jgi:hypothetical protein
MFVQFIHRPVRNLICESDLTVNFGNVTDLCVSPQVNVVAVCFGYSNSDTHRTVHFAPLLRVAKRHTWC